jgi:hypothetical protein
MRRRRTTRMSIDIFQTPNAVNEDDDKKPATAATRKATP